MLSGQGRHRRPRQVPAILVTAGVTGSAIAIPLLGASSASAADAETWDKVAECESGGAWSAKGSGYYGGFQLTQDTWEQYGGLSYAPSADQASRSQQIHVAEKVLADRGPDAWPNCAPTAGLEKGGKSADVDPGVPSAPPRSSDSEGSKDSGESSRSGEEKEEGAGSGDSDTADDGSEKAEKPGSSTESRDKSHDSDSKDSKDSGDGKGGDAAKGAKDAGGDSRESGGKHRKPAGDAGKSGADDSASPEESGESGAPGASDGATPGTDGASDDRPSGRHRGGSADENAPSGDTGPGRHASRGEARDVPGAERPSGTYTVRSGDNLSAIADSHDLDGGWTDLYAGNKKTVGSDPDLILPGQRLELSADDKAGTEGKSGEK
ncbi:transglycosylase family protein [Streptomyces sp. NRRL B-1347]|uniref:LysM peptidoglycan-binding domain-containing protein n=1 Tax=Streptomyces sp. NRRL B-1347 TaxID=1476877 RepID=UPI0004C4FC31|nr:transglycosylase family protein [Streptomyces sp. NRRL B-1347]